MKNKNQVNKKLNNLVKKIKIYFLIFTIAFLGLGFGLKQAEADHTFDTKLQIAESSGATVTGSYTAGADSTLLVLSIVTTGTVRGGGKPTYNYIALTQAGTQLYDGSEGSAELWYLLNPPTGVSYTISIPNPNTQQVMAQVSTYKAQSGYSSAFDSTNQASSAGSTNPTVTLSSTVNGAVFVDSMFSGLSSSPTANNGTLLYENDTGQEGNASQYYLQPTFGSRIMSWTAATDDWSTVAAAFKEVLMTTLSTGTNPGNVIIAPGATITPVNGFTLTTSVGTDAITSITVNLSTNKGIGTLTITDAADTVLGSIGGGTGAGIVTGLNAISITSTNATTSGTAFKVKVTPLSHADMPAPNGGEYVITGRVTDWASSNTKVGQATDTSSTVTIDNYSPRATFGTDGVITGATASKIANAIAIDSTYMYVAGDDATPDWRIEKRLLSTGAVDSGFGTSGVIIGDTASTTANAIAIDSTYMYVAGNSSTTLRIEKRLLSTGAVDSGFGTSGVITGDTASAQARAIAIDATYMYVAGYDNGLWRIEKRLLSTGAVDSGFGTSGVINSATANASANAIAIDGTYMYVAGYDSTSNWRIEKRYLTSGALISNFGTSGVIASDTASSSAYAIAIDSTYMYVAGTDANSDWRIEKRLLSTGAVVSSFGTSGVITSDAASNFVYAIAIDATYMYVAGYDATTHWRIEKRLLSDGTLVSGFGTSGVITGDAASAQANAIVIDGTYMYVAGNSNGLWRIEKRLLSTAGAGEGILPTATAGNAQVSLTWPNPDDADFQQAYIYCKTSPILSGDAPAEGTDPTVDGADCDGTARLKYVGTSSPQIITGLTDIPYYFRIYARDNNGNFTAYASTYEVSATPTAPAAPIITTYTNTTETGLNYADSCTLCGARIGGGGAKQTVTITGTNFGTDPGAGNYSSSTNNIQIGTHKIASANVTAWSDTSITFLTDSATTGDADSDWGANFGGATALTVTAGNQTSATGLNFYVFPQITSITQPSGFPADGAREYDDGDTDGIITINGTRFGTAEGSGSVTILGSASTTNSWSNTAIEAQVPIAISDSTYTGSIVMTQGTGGNSQTSSYNPLRILPRITSLVPSSSGISEAMTVNGNHLCQAGSSSCPTSFTSDKVTFASSVVATTFTSWSNTAIVTAVPTGAVTGNVFVTSNTYTSNNSSFTVVSSVPNNPTSLGQFKDGAFSQSISTGGMISTIPLYLKMSMEALIGGGTLYPQFEYKPIATSFACTTATSCASAVEGTGVAGPGPTDGSKSISPASDGSYHWQARTKHTRNATDYYSAWVLYGGNAENVADFIIDRTPPAITNVSSGTPGTNGTTITWSTTGELSTTQVQYNTTGTFVTNCATNNDCTIIKNVSPMVHSHSVTISNLNSGITYYFRVRSKDSAGNEAIDTNKLFNTQTENHPSKTIKIFINGTTGSINSATTYHFTFDAPETSPTVKDAYIEVLGLVSGGFSGTITVQGNSASAREYEVSTASGKPTLYRFVYPIPSPNIETNLNLNDESPCTNGSGGVAPCNKVILTPSTGSINVLSTKIITTYSYTP